MKIIQAYAHFFTDEGLNSSGITASLETYILSRQTWKKIATAKSDIKGTWQVKVEQIRDIYAPILRLTELGSPTPRVLAQGGYLSYNKTKNILNIDFGHIERLEETAYPLAASSSLFRRSKLTISGQAKKENISITSIFREARILSNESISRPIASTIKHAPILERFDAEVIKFKSTETKLQSKIIEKDILLSRQNQDIKTIKAQLSKSKQKLSQSVAIEKELRKQNQDFVKEAQRKTPIQDIAASIGNEVDEANKKLRKRNRPYQFGRIELDLRGTVSSDGQSMALASLVDLKAAGRHSVLPSIKMEILPHNPPTKITGVVVPDVVGLTETVVRRLLQAAGLRLEVVNKSVVLDDNAPIGQSIQQFPESNKRLARGESVLVIFAAPDIS